MRGYPLRCNGNDIPEKDYLAVWKQVQAHIKQFIQFSERICLASESNPKRLAQAGKAFVTLRVFEAQEAFVECDQVLTTLAMIWNACGSRGGK